MSALSVLKKQFPQIEKVIDSKETIEISVTAKDSQSGNKKNPQSCALAKACIRTKIADAAIIGIGYSYLIKGPIATRYKTSVGVGREITSFDRNQQFEEGSYYKLSKIPKSNRLGGYKGDGGPHKTKRQNTQKVHHHHTSNIRIIKKFK
jgi:hypothetical protein